ncbi:MAG: FliI/YscN family ATPase [Pseudomonadales bacterium]
MAVDCVLPAFPGDFAARLVRARQGGTVTACIGMLLEARGLEAELGEQVDVVCGAAHTAAEVVGFKGPVTYLMPLGPMAGLRVGAQVRLSVLTPHIDAQAAVGRVIDASGQPLDGAGPIALSREPVIRESRINPLRRPPIESPLDVGVTAINALLTVGKGQRVGLFAGSGVGKSVLLGMLARNTVADVVILGMIGERGREVREFIDENFHGSLGNVTVVVSPADDSPALRMRGAWLATELAEAHRRRGRNVLLLMDSLTRFSQAQREIGLALGEPPTTKGSTPSVFALLPRLVERAGMTEEGSITAFYTVLMEEDDLQDPIVDAARAILDGHLVLSRRLADTGVFPAIDVAASISRLQTRIVGDVQRQQAARFRALWARYGEQEDLITMGAYQRGTDPLTDEAIVRRARLLEFLKQAPAQKVSYAEAVARLQALFADGQALIP